MEAEHIKYSTPMELPKWVIDHFFYNYSTLTGSTTTQFSTLDAHELLTQAFIGYQIHDKLISKNFFSGEWIEIDILGRGYSDEQ